MPTVTGIATSFIDFTRASNATVTDSDGKVKWAPHNLLLASEQFDASSWVKSNVTVSANSVAAPNSTTTADTIAEDTVTQYHYAVQTVSTIAGAQYTASVFMKAGTQSYGIINVFNTTTASLYAAASFNLSTGAVANSGVAGTGYAIVGSPSITSLGSGWYLCSLTFTNGTTDANRFSVAVSNDGTIGSYGMGNYLGASKTIYAWGAHLYRSDLAMQPNTSAYPMYNPTTPKNVLGYTEDLGNAAWSKTNTGSSNPVVTANVAIGPNGLQTADQIVFPATTSAQVSKLFQIGPSLTGTQTLSIYLRGAVGGEVVYLIGYNGLSYFTTTCTLTTSWQRFSATSTANGTTYLQLGQETAAGNGGMSACTIYAWGAQLSDSASLDSYVPVYGAAVTSAAYYGPRRDFDPVTLACKGLLVEEQRANLVLYSAEFNSWTKPNITVSSNVLASPTGALDADKLVEDTANNSHVAQTNPTVSNATVHAISVYAKAAERNWLAFGTSGFGTGYTYFNLSTGVVGTVLASHTASIRAVGNGWYRCTIVATSTTTTPAIYIGAASADGTAVYTGDGTSGLYLWGAQLEVGSFATSYIPTGVATATRNADVASVSTQAFPYSQSDGTLVFNFGAMNFAGSMGGSAPYDAVIGIVTNGSRYGRQFAASNGNSWYVINRTGTPNATSAISGSAAFAPTNGPVAAHKLAMGISATDMAGVVNGGTVTTTAITSAPTGAADLLYINPSMNGHIRQITYLPRRISNAELVTRST